MVVVVGELVFSLFCKMSMVGQSIRVRMAAVVGVVVMAMVGAGAVEVETVSPWVVEGGMVKDQIAVRFGLLGLFKIKNIELTMAYFITPTHRRVTICNDSSSAQIHDHSTCPLTDEELLKLAKP